MISRTIRTILPLLVFSSISYASNPPLQLSLNFPHYPAAAVTGTHAVVLNPAALFLNKEIMLSGYHSYLKGDFSGDNALIISAAGIGFSYQKLNLNVPNSVKRFDFATSTRLIANLYAGASYVYYKTDGGMIDKAHSWDFSLLYHAARMAAISLQAKNINKHRFTEDESAIQYVLSTALRPRGELITIGADLSMFSGQSSSDIDWNLSARFKAREGLHLFAGLDNEGTFGAGLEFQFGHTTAGGEGFFDNDAKYTGSTIYGTISTASNEQVIRRPQSILNVDFSGDIPEESSRPFLWGKSLQTVFQKLKKIETAKDDPQVKGLLVTIRNPNIGWGRISDFRDAIKEFRKSGKPVIAYLGPSVANGGYFLASAADKIYMQPVDGLNLTGLSAQITFYKGTLDKLGIEAEMERSGEYKSYPEVLTDTTMSAPFRESIEAVLNDLYEFVCSEIAAGRNLSSDSVKSLIDIGPFTSTQAESLKLVDGRLYAFELEDKLPELFGGALSLSSDNNYQESPRYRERFCEPPEIALIAIEGGIVKGSSGFDYLDGSTVGSGTVSQAIRYARDNSAIKALVVRINSPGGDAIASDLIWAELAEASKVKPTIISMSDVCASGGYYIASAGDLILLQPTTVTGSIGVFAGKANLSGLYSKIGLHTETVRRGDHAGMFSWSEPFTDDERSILKRQVNDMYIRFTSVVSEGRALSVDSVHSIARGRTWSGKLALENGLADRQGNVLDAVEIARQRANILDDDYRIIEMPRRKLIPRFTDYALSAFASTLGIDGRDGLNLLKHTAASLSDTGLQARMPFTLSIN